MMHGHEKSDSVIVAAKPANKVAHPAVEQSAAEPTTAEPVEPRAETKGNADPLPGSDARAVREICAVTSSREDTAHRVRTLCGGTPQAARAWQAGDLQLPGLYLHLRQDSPGQIPDQKEDPAGPHAGEAQDDQRGDVATHAPADPRAREVAGTGRQRLLRLPCSADQWPRTGGVRAPRHGPLAAGAEASKPKRSDHVGTDDAAGERLAPETNHPPSLAERSLRRHTPEVGAVCGKAARTVLCGGRAMKSASLVRCGLLSK